MNRFEQVKDDLRREPRRWLVTGVAGFIGSNLLETLLGLGQHVVGLDDFSSGYRRNLQEVLQNLPREGRSFRFVDGDIRDYENCLEACEGADYVLHQAAIGSVPRSVQDPGLVNEVNVDGTINVMMAARECRVRRVVYASSSAVYGDCPELPLREERRGQPLSPYAISKLTDENYADVFSRIYGIELVGLRYFNVFGPRQDPLGSYAAVIPQWIHALLSGEVCHIHGDGETSRDFVAVADVVQANLLAATTPHSPPVHRVYNVGASRRTSLNQLYTMLADGATRLRPRHAIQPSVHDDFREGDIRHSQADVSRITSELGYSPASDLAGALQQTIAWYVDRLRSMEVVARSA
jgi:UDP-N-acetylglucosamine/UDP-N-acetyl-alpha-D-glucosaminouronate 4-epimerase